jgi:hypothetical protein
MIWCGLIGFFRSQASLQAEILVLRHQLNVLRRKSPKRPTFANIDRLIFAGLYGLAPKVLSALAIVRPETVVRWHRAGFRLYWRWKSKSPSGRPKLPVDIRTLIRETTVPELTPIHFPVCYFEPARCLVLSHGGGNETALQSRRRTG